MSPISPEKRAPQPLPEQPSEKPEEKKEAEAKELPPSREVPELFERPMEEAKRRVIEQYGQGFGLNPESKKSLAKILQREVDERMVEFCKQWYEEHQEDLEEARIPADVSEEKKCLLLWKKEP